YCLEHPDFLNGLPIPVRLKARLARQPAEHSETGMFQTIPSSTTRAVLDAADEGLDEDEEDSNARSKLFSERIITRALLVGLAVAFLATLAGYVTSALRASALAEQLQALERELEERRIQPPGSVATVRTQPVKLRPEEPTMHLGRLTPAQLLELHVDVSESKANQFQITIDKVNEGRLMQIRRVARDSNRELRLAFNSSAFGPGEYLLRLDAYDWRGQAREYGWIRVRL